MSYRKLDVEQYQTQVASLVRTAGSIDAENVRFANGKSRLQEALRNYARLTLPETPVVGTVLRPTVWRTTASRAGGVSQKPNLFPITYETDDRSWEVALQDREMLTAARITGPIRLRPKSPCTAVRVGAVGKSTIGLSAEGRPLVTTRETRGESVFWFVEREYDEITLVADGVLQDLTLLAANWEPAPVYVDYRIAVDGMESFVVAANWTSTAEMHSVPSGLTPEFPVTFSVITELGSTDLDPVVNGFRMTSERAHVNPRKLGHMTDPIFTAEDEVTLRMEIERPGIIVRDLVIDMEIR